MSPPSPQDGDDCGLIASHFVGGWSASTFCMATDVTELTRIPNANLKSDICRASLGSAVSAAYL